MSDKSEAVVAIDDRSAGGIVYCAPEFAKELDGIAELFAEHPAKLAEAARFAMAIGIQLEKRIKREEWSKKGQIRNIAHLGQFAEGRDFEMLFDLLGILDKNVALNILISEYIAGGMRWLVDNEIKTRTNFDKMKDSFGFLFK